MLEVTLFNTLTRQKEVLKPLKKGKVSVYTCGPTVYDYVHIGNLRTYLFEDFLRRTLNFAGYKVKHIENVTDVGHLVSDADDGEDKMIKALKREGLPPTKESLFKLADLYFDAYRQDRQALNILPPDQWVKATDHVVEMIELIKKIQANGYTYETQDGVYYDTQKFVDYAELAKLDQKGLRAGARVTINNQKKHPADFALWIKAVGDNQNHVMVWESPWGSGFPGWHIECSAMSMKYLGEIIDIHCGGVDHIPTHHTNEIAQNFAATKQQVVRCWLHGEFLVLDTGRMGKSVGNFIQLQTLIDKGFEPLAYRYLTLQTHYRQKLTFSYEALTAAQNAYRNIIETIQDWQAGSAVADKKYLDQFTAAIIDDLNMPQALAVLWAVIRDEALSPAIRRATINQFDLVLGLSLATVAPLIVPSDIQALAEERQKARENKDWQASDKLRQEIASRGYQVEDTDDGFKIKVLNT